MGENGKLTVLQFVHTYMEKNGISIHVQNIVENFPHEVKSVVVHGKGESVLPFFSSLRFPFFEFFDALGKKCDVIHIHGYGNFFSYFGAWLALLKGKRLVWTIHGYPRVIGMKKVFYYVYRYLMAPLIFWKADKIISVSEDVVPLLKKETSKDITVIGNGINLDMFKAKTNYKKSRYICYVGRLDPDKGVFRMLDIKDKVMFIGPDENNTKQLLKKKAREKKADISFIEASYGDMPQAYELCRYVVLPSKYEGFPLTVLESVSMERPFLSTDVGETKKVLSGLFEKPKQFIIKDDIQQKIDELEELNLTGKMKRARKRLESFSWSAVSKRLMEIYSQITQKNRK